MEKTLECIKEMFEEELKKLKKKGEVTKEDAMTTYYALASIDKIDKLLGRDEDAMSYGFNGHSYGTNLGRTYGYSGTSRSPVTGRYVSNGSYGTNGYDYNMMPSGYSGHSINDRMVAALEPMYDKASSDHERQVVSNWINRIRTEM